MIEFITGMIGTAILIAAAFTAGVICDRIGLIKKYLKI